MSFAVAVIGLAVLLMADRTGDFDGPVALTALGIGIVLAGLGIIVSGLRGRRSGALGALAIVGILVALPVGAAQTTDWVVQADFRPSDAIRGWTHATVDGSGDIRRAEVALDGRWGRRNLGSLSYIVDRSNPVDGPLNRNYEFVQVAAQQFVYGNWGVAVAGIADLERDVITRSEVGLLFDDDCFRFEIGFRRDETRVRPSGPSEGIYVRLNLATFGGSGYGRRGLR